jgi:hypothetical protein
MDVLRDFMDKHAHKDWILQRNGRRSQKLSVSLPGLPRTFDSAAQLFKHWAKKLQSYPKDDKVLEAASCFIRFMEARGRLSVSSSHNKEDARVAPRGLGYARPKAKKNQDDARKRHFRDDEEAPPKRPRLLRAIQPAREESTVGDAPEEGATEQQSQGSETIVCVPVTAGMPVNALPRLEPLRTCRPEGMDEKTWVANCMERTAAVDRHHYPVVTTKGPEYGKERFIIAEHPYLGTPKGGGKRMCTVQGFWSYMVDALILPWEDQSEATYCAIIVRIYYVLHAARTTTELKVAKDRLSLCYHPDKLATHLKAIGREYEGEPHAPYLFLQKLVERRQRSIDDPMRCFW